MSESNLFEEYHKKIEEFLTFDELNIKDSQMVLASVRHYWVGRLMHHKQQIIKLKRTKDKALTALRTKMENESPINLSQKTIIESINKHEVVQKINDEIVNNEFLIEYLTKVEMNLRDAQYGMTNLTKIITLETT